MLLTIRSADDLRQWRVADWDVLVALAAVSAEPETFAELEQAVWRYQPYRDLSATSNAAADIREAEDEGPWCLIDLVGRTAVAGSGYELPEPVGAWQADEDEEFEGFPVVWLATPKDWQFVSDEGCWWDRVLQRAAERQRRPLIDTRAILFGSPLLRFIATRVRTASTAHRLEKLDEDREHAITRSIHADWLMRQRKDLRGQTPRDVLLGRHDRIGLDLQYRADQWSKQGSAPPALSPDSLAYRFGGFGTTEVVLYFDLIRALLAEAWERVRHAPSLTAGDLAARLAAYRDGWLNAPYEESSSLMTCAELIENERRRMPITGNVSHLDHDCPICRAMADENFGPMFMWFDGHHLELEDEFAFSMDETREEWERKQQEFRKFNEEFEREQAERKAAGKSPYDTFDDADFADNSSGDAKIGDSAWKRSYVNWDLLATEGAPPGFARSAIGFLLAELTEALKGQPNGAAHLEALIAAYVSFARADDSVVARSAAEELRQQLEAIASACPEFVAQSADLQSRLDEVLRTAVV